MSWRTRMYESDPTDLISTVGAAVSMDVRIFQGLGTYENEVAANACTIFG